MRGDVLNDLLLMREHVQVIRTAFPWKDEHKKEFNFLLKNCDWENVVVSSNERESMAPFFRLLLMYMTPYRTIKLSANQQKHI